MSSADWAMHAPSSCATRKLLVMQERDPGTSSAENKMSSMLVSEAPLDMNDSFEIVQDESNMWTMISMGNTPNACTEDIETVMGTNAVNINSISRSPSIDLLAHHIADDLSYISGTTLMSEWTSFGDGEATVVSLELADEPVAQTSNHSDQSTRQLPPSSSTAVFWNVRSHSLGDAVSKNLEKFLFMLAQACSPSTDRERHLHSNTDK